MEKLCSLLKRDAFRLNVLRLCLMHLPNNIYHSNVHIILRHHRKSEVPKKIQTLVKEIYDINKYKCGKNKCISMTVSSWWSHASVLVVQMYLIMVPL